MTHASVANTTVATSPLPTGPSTLWPAIRELKKLSEAPGWKGASLPSVLQGLIRTFEQRAWISRPSPVRLARTPCCQAERDYRGGIPSTPSFSPVLPPRM
jgi:hypothetical protein